MQDHTTRYKMLYYYSNDSTKELAVALGKKDEAQPTTSYSVIFLYLHLYNTYYPKHLRDRKR